MRIKTAVILILSVIFLYCGPALVRADRAPDWLVGRYHAFNRKYKVDVDLSVYPDGNVTSIARFASGKSSTDNGRYLDGQIKMGSGTFNLVRNDRGFELVQVNDRSNRAEYRLIARDPVPSRASDPDRSADDDWGDDRRIPDWLIGHFEGHNRKYRVDTELRIHDDGIVTSVGHFRDGKRSTDSGTYAHHKIKVGSGTYLVERTRAGFRLTQESDPANVAEYRRVD